MYSGFGIFDVVRQKVSVFARVDRFNDPNPDGAGIAFLPIDPRVQYTFTLTGVEFFLLPSVRFSPNLETVSYGTLPDGTSPKTDVVFRATTTGSGRPAHFHRRPMKQQQQSTTSTQSNRISNPEGA